MEGCLVQAGLLHDAEELLLADLAVAVAVGLVDHLLELLVGHVLAELLGDLHPDEHGMAGLLPRLDVLLWQRPPRLLGRDHVRDGVDVLPVGPLEALRLALLDLLRDALDLVEEVYQTDYNNLGALSRASMLAILNYFDIAGSCQFFDVKDLKISGKGNDRVLSIVQAVNGNNYITGHGAINYLDHRGFEAAGVTVKYMNYQSLHYKQLHGSFTPYVSALDLIANCGKEGEGFIANNKSTIRWDEFISISLKKSIKYLQTRFIL